MFMSSVAEKDVNKEIQALCARHFSDLEKKMYIYQSFFKQEVPRKQGKKQLAALLSLFVWSIVYSDVNLS